MNVLLFFSRLEHSAVNLAESIQQGGAMPVPAGSVAPSLLEVCSILIILGNDIA